MVDESIKSQLREHFQKITKPVALVYDSGEHEYKQELVEYLQAVTDCSDKISIQENSSQGKNPLHFTLLSEGTETGIHFDGIPGGHEFTSLILAILQAGGSPVRLDSGIQERLKTITEPLEFETVVSLECHNCPDVVQTLNSVSLINPKIQHTMIDGGLFPELVEKRKIQGVPSVFLNGEPFATGKVDASVIIERLLEKSTNQSQAPGNPQGSSQFGSQVPGNAGLEKKIYDVAVIGGGPGGVASAVYSARKGLKVIMVADRVGGQVKDTMGIENLISIRETTGPVLAGTLAEQIKANGIELREYLRVTELRDAPHGQPKEIVLNTGEILQSKTVIVATGAKWRELNVPGEKENIGNGVAYCPHCDGPFFKGKDVVVVGGGNSGVEAALDLSGIVKSVTVLEYANTYKADQVLLDRMARTPNIKSYASMETLKISASNGKVDAIHCRDRISGEEKVFPINGVFIQIGLLPNSGFAKDFLEMNRFGEILVDAHCKTNRPGFFACGDVTNTPYKQIIIAMGEGAKASLSAFEYLLKLPVET